MGFRFNPSSNNYTEQMSNTALSLGVEQWKEQEKKKQMMEILKKLQGSGLVQGAEPAPQAAAPMMDPVQSGLLPPEAAMSMPGGGVGNVNGQQIMSKMPSMPAPQNRMTLQPSKQKPYILDPLAAAMGEPKLKDNPDYESPKNAQTRKNQEMGISTRVRKEFIDRPEVKDYMTVKASINSMDAMLKKSISGDVSNKVALDQGLITMYNKLTDPQSVVRESEYARTPENLPIVNRVLGAIDKFQKGGAGLTDDDRKALVLGAKIIGNERGKIYQGTLDEYKSLASEYGIDEKLVTRGIKDHEDFSYDGLVSNKAPKASSVTPQSTFSRDDLLKEAKRRGLKI